MKYQRFLPGLGKLFYSKFFHGTSNEIYLNPVASHSCTFCNSIQQPDKMQRLKNLKLKAAVARTKFKIIRPTFFS
jgi:hypothetical protein